MPVIPVRHATGSYPVYVELGALGRLNEFSSGHLIGRRLALISDTNVYPLFERFRSGGGSEWRPPPTSTTVSAPVSLPQLSAELIIPAGEASKTRDRWAELSDALLERGFGRDSAIVALGGGMVGDLAGFVAATYLRGIPCIQVPTTLLAMVDASVGGKTGVDTPRGKNLIGAFHPPAAVVADPLALRTLPEGEYRAGLAEAVKHGLIADRTYFSWLSTVADQIAAREMDTLMQLVHRSVEIKAAVVADDEREAGRRAILNAGHTIAHAIEHASNYTLSHGEAVAIGLVVESRLAEDIGVGQSGLSARVADLLSRLGLPVKLESALSGERLREAMTRDKKNRGSAIRFALPAEVGMMARGENWTVEPPMALVAECLERLG
jgi:3-dehydroquinate synthase